MGLTTPLVFLLICSSLAAGETEFSWANVNGTSFVPPTHNQNFPAPCSSGWALSAVDVFNSRMKIRRQGASPDLEISSQVLLSCDEYDYGCMGVTIISISGRTSFSFQVDQKKQYH
jgi:hypothetical protein